MINYSIYIASSKPGTKKADITDTKAYGASQIHEKLTFDQFCQHIAEHNSPFSKGHPDRRDDLPSRAAACRQQRQPRPSRLLPQRAQLQPRQDD